MMEQDTDTPQTDKPVTKPVQEKPKPKPVEPTTADPGSPSRETRDSKGRIIEKGQP